MSSLRSTNPGLYDMLWRWLPAAALTITMSGVGYLISRDTDRERQLNEIQIAIVRSEERAITRTDDIRELKAKDRALEKKIEQRTTDRITATQVSVLVDTLASNIQSTFEAIERRMDREHGVYNQRIQELEREGRTP